MTSYRCIVLKTIRYGDSSLVTHCFVRGIGSVSYLLRGILKSKKKGLRAAYFQPLIQLQTITRHNGKGTLQSIIEVKLDYSYKNLLTNFRKQAMVFFLSEVLAKCLHESDNDMSLYDFIADSLKWLDSNKHINNFHLSFLIKLSKYFGFYPNMKDMNHSFFDLQEGMFYLQKPLNPYLDGNVLKNFKQFLTSNFQQSSEIKLYIEKRRELLESICQYYALHNYPITHLKSVEVLRKTL